MKIEVDFDAKDYGLIKTEDLKKASESLRVLYQLIWCEAAYDPFDASTEKFARECLPHIRELVKILGFKK